MDCRSRAAAVLAGFLLAAPVLLSPAALRAEEPPKAALILVSDTACSVSVDGKGAAEIQADEPLRLELAAGEYVLSAVTRNGRRWSRILRLESPKTIVQIEFARAAPSPPGPGSGVSVPAAPPAAASPPAAVIAPGPGSDWVLVAAGEFEMGCSPGDDQCNPAELPRRGVRVARPFQIMARPVTVAEFRSWASASQRRLPPQPRWSADHVPVVNVTWDDAAAFCSAQAARLPSEVEWEYAARAGSTAPRYGEIDAIAWYAGNSGRKAHPVGQKLPNAWGLYDMLGNVWEWTAEVFRSAPGTDDTAPGVPEDLRSLRGGSWKNSARQIRVSNRGRLAPDDREDDDGFRCARDVTPR
jgi:formylglycine-generating enzyme required for sulfatase activity